MSAKAEDSDLTITREELLYEADGVGYIANIGDLPMTLKRLKWMRPFLTSLANSGIISKACRDAGISSARVTALLIRDPDFRYLVDLCNDHATDLMETVAMRRATQGTLVQEFYKGKPVWKTDPETGKVIRDANGNPIPEGKRHYSDAMMIYLLKARRYEKNGKRIQHTGEGGGPIKVKNETSPEQIDNAVERALKGV